MATPLTVLYQDDHLIAVDKPAGQLVHPASDPQPEDEVTLKILRDQIGQKVWTCHRLDRPTCGILLFAKNRTAARTIGLAFDHHQIEKCYHAIAIGHPAQSTWTCHQPLRKDSRSPEQAAETHFQVLTRLDRNLCLLEVRPKTGRYHQIRRHLLHEGHPIVGDYRYLPFDECEARRRELAIGTRMLLQAKSLTFLHPASREILTITAPTDPLIARLCQSTPAA